MKKLVALILVLGCTVLLGSSVFAAPTIITKTAEVTFTGGTVSFSVDLLTLASSTATTKISWDAASIPLDSSTINWKVANAYASLNANITNASGKVYIYQDNKNATAATYKATTPRTEGTVANPLSKYSGLIKGNSGGGENGEYLPMSFIISTTTLTSSYVIDPETTGANQYKNRYITDKSDSNYVAAAPYTLVADATGFVVNTSASNTPNYILPKTTTAKMYFGAGFKNILAGTSYGTDKIIFEVVTE